MYPKPSHASYGVLDQRNASTAVDRAVEELTCFGYTIVDGGYSVAELDDISRMFDETHRMYIERFGRDRLASIDELNGIRLPMLIEPGFARLATNKIVLNVISRLIVGKFILNQQNGVINPAGAPYNQGAWHRDLPYQHFVSSRPISINALFCVDEFTAENGGTCVLPASHLQEPFPSDSFIERHTIQATAPRGSYLILDAMTFHRGAFNDSPKPRRAVNHVYTIPHIKQQIDMPAALGDRITDPALRDLLGYGYPTHHSVAEYFSSRALRY